MKKNKDIWIFIISIIILMVIFITMIGAFTILKIYLTQAEKNQPEINNIKPASNPEKIFSGDPLITPAREIENLK